MCIVRAGKVFGRSAKMVKAYHFIVQCCIVPAFSGVGSATQLLERHMMHCMHQRRTCKALSRSKVIQRTNQRQGVRRGPFTKETPCQISVFGNGLHVQLLYTQSSLAQKHPNLFPESTAPYSLPCLLRRRVLSTQSFLPREKKAMTTATLRYKSDHLIPHPTFREWGYLREDNDCRAC